MEARELIGQIRERALTGVDVSRLAELSAEEQRTLLLAETERLLSTEATRNVVYWMVMQITDGRGNLAYNNPLIDYDTLDLRSSVAAELPGEQLAVARLASRLAYLCYCLWDGNDDCDGLLYYLGIRAEDDEEAMSVYEEMSIGHTALTNWVKTSAYRRVAASVVEQMVTVAGNRAAWYSSVEQDYFFGFLVSTPSDMDDVAACDDYTSRGLATLEYAERHRQSALALGLDRECGSIVDALCGTLMHDYPPQLVALARELQQAASSSLARQEQGARSKEQGAEWASSVLDACQRVLERSGIDLAAREYNLPLNYLYDWLLLKYRAKRYGVEF